MPERSDRHGWIDLLVPDGPFLSAAALDVQTVGENWPTRLSAEQRSLLTTPPASDIEEGEGWDDSSWDGRRARVNEMLIELLGYREGKTLAVAPRVAAHHHIYRARVSADFVIHAADDPDDARMVVICGPDATDDPSRLDPARTHTHDGWVSTPVQRAALLARHANADLALVTNGREHLLVNVVTGTTGSAMWTVNGLEDRHARDAFVALLHKQRVLHGTVPLSKLIELSQDRQHELTDTLGKQVRRAAEALVNAISRANRTSRGRLLEGLSGQQVYAATTRVLMRTVFLLVAEERGLLPVAENQLFADQYAMSTLLDKLEEDAYRNRSAMERRAGAWQRMMALSRSVHAGIEHDDLRLPAYGGNLFDPDEHPFLEARVAAADDDGFVQLDIGVVDDFTVLTVLRHLQIADGQRISFRSLDVEQIGHVYEALLDHSALIVPENQVAVLGLIGKAGDEPEVSLVELEGWTAKSDKELGKQLVDLGVAAEAKGVYQAIDDGLAPDSEVAQTLNVAVANDPVLRERVERYAPLLRTDARGIALVFRPGDVYVTETSSKRDSGTAYTPRSLADEIAKHTLDPLIYDPGPQNEPDESKWKLKAPEQILDLKICDPAVGSAAILVGAVRYLAEALLQARVEAGELSAAYLASASSDAEAVDVRVEARREVVGRCTYGVDRDPMAVEMAKLSLWLTTMARDQPFTFLDHAIRHGDSLVGLTSLEQLRRLHLDVTVDLFGLDHGLLAETGAFEWRERIDEVIAEVTQVRKQLQDVKLESVHDAHRQATLFRQERSAARVLEVVADAVTATCLVNSTERESTVARALSALTASVGNLDNPVIQERLAERTSADREAGNPNPSLPRRFLHWPLAFPEVWADGRKGFDAMVGNPPFVGRRNLTGAIGKDVREYCVKYVAGISGSATDLIAYFVRRMAALSAGFGTIATSSIAEGDNKLVALRAITRGGKGSLYRADPVAPWPGQAQVTIAKLWWTSSTWSGPRSLDGRRVPVIAPDLYPTDLGEPFDVTGRKHFASFGQIARRMAGAMEQLERDELLSRCPADEPVVRPYLNAQELSANPGHVTTRYIVDFGRMSLDEAQSFPCAFERVDNDLDGGRLATGPYARGNWWQFRDIVDDLVERLAATEQAIAMPVVSKFAIPIMVSSDQVFSNALCVIPEENYALLGFMSSFPHNAWLERYGSTMGTGYRYGPGNVFRTFPLPDPLGAEVTEHAESLSVWRRRVSVESELGLTKMYAAYHSESARAHWVQELRERHQRLDRAVLAAYGWDDIEPKHGLHETRYGTFFTAHAAARDEVLGRLLDLNFSQQAAATGESRAAVERKAMGLD